MPPGGGGGGGGGEGSKHGRTEQHHQPATGRRDEGAPSLPTPSLPAIAPAASQKRKQRQPTAASLPEGPLVEILSRVPYRSLCRFRCVSKQWLALCSDTDIVKRAPQTLAGFFHSHDGELRFSNLSGGGTPLVDPSSFPFLWCSRYYSFQLDQCSSSSLLLCKCWGLEDEQDDDKGEYVVCNPITGQWTTLPPILCQDDEDDDPEYYELVDPFLGFDPAVPSRFVVLARLVESVDHVAVFSSETGQWARSSGWEHRGWYPAVAAECVFLNGMLHFMHLLLDRLSIAAVDTHGKVCREIPLPEGMKGDGSGYGSVGCSQGLLHAWFMDRYHYQLSVWVLEDYCSGAWTLKHTVDVPKLFGRESNKEDCDEEDCGEEDETYNYEMFAIHPERNLIFLTDWKEVNLSYHMDSREVHHMATSGDFLGGLPYIPCFADLPDVVVAASCM